MALLVQWSVQCFFEDDNVLQNAKTYIVSESITKLDIEIAAAEFAIKHAESFAVESNIKHLNVNDQNAVLKIKEKNHFGVSNSDAALILYMPEGTSVRKIIPSMLKKVLAAFRLTERK